ncbi:MAG: ATP-binding cassette domain-containing protein [Methanobrevibacter sp.]|jgi:ABC-2 type transport system ATP-binding protein|nr:ATP-binding cassette domain-containing protein [Candidatus Methanovirga procula]
MNAIEIKNISKNFDGLKAIDNLSLDIPENSVFAILGPNGAGKTTVINILSMLLKPDKGTVKILGFDIMKESKKVRELVGLTLQYACVDEALTAKQNLLVFGQLLGLSRKEAKIRGNELLKEFNLEDAANKPIQKFSGGMRRRLDLAVSLIDRPKLIFLDEPTTGLDPRTRNQMWSTIKNLVKKGSTVLLTTQYLEEADQLSDEIAIMDEGKVIAKGTAESLKKEYKAKNLDEVFLKITGDGTDGKNNNYEELNMIKEVV